MRGWRGLLRDQWFQLSLLVTIACAAVMGYNRFTRAAGNGRQLAAPSSASTPQSTMGVGVNSQRGAIRVEADAVNTMVWVDDQYEILGVHAGHTFPVNVGKHSVRAVAVFEDQEFVY